MPTQRFAAAQSSPEPSSPPPTAAAARLAEVGSLLFGPRFHSALAQELKVSRPLVFAMVNGQRRVTPEIERRLATIIRSRILPRLETKIRTLASLAESIEDKLNAYDPARFESDPVAARPPAR